MSIVNVNRETGDNFQDNQRYDDLSFTSASREYKPTQQRSDWRVIVATIAGMCSAFVLLAIVYGVWKTIYCWGERHYDSCTRLDAIEPIIFQGVLFLVIGAVVAAIVVKLRTYANQQRAITNRTNLVLDRFGDQYPADFFNRLQTPEMMQYLMERYYVANNLQQQIAPHQIYKGVNTLSMPTTHQLTAPNTIDTPDAPLQAVSFDVWLDWINNKPHFMLAGQTNAGKSTTARAILIRRLQQPKSQLFIIDPQSNGWFNFATVGNGWAWAEITDAITALYDEYAKRHAIRAQHLRDTGSALPVTHFDRLTSVMDEAFEIRKKLDTSGGKRTNYWEMYAEILGSGARIVNMSAGMLTQTANVEDIGLSAPLRNNFTRIALDTQTIKHMISYEERDTDRRQKLYEALIGMQYPATTVMDAQVHLLDRTGLDQIQEPIITPDNIWQPTKSHANVPPVIQHDLITTLRNLRASGVTREQARTDYGLSFDNDLWSTL